MLEEPEAASQNKNDLARRVELTQIDNRFKPDKYEQTMYEGVWISRIWIVRTLLYFTDHIIFETPEQAISGLPNETETDKAILQITSKATGGHEQIVCHPESEEVAQVNKDFANLIDAGVILELDGKTLGCFSYFNSFSFRGEIESLNDLKEVAEFYEFIEVFSQSTRRPTNQWT